MFAHFSLFGLLWFGCAKPVPPPPAPVVEVVQEEPVQNVVVTIKGYAYSVWGGDGENLSAIWDQEVGLTVQNLSDEAIVVQEVRWKLGGVLTEFAIPQRTVAPGQTESLLLNASMSEEEATAIQTMTEALLILEVDWVGRTGVKTSPVRGTVTVGG